MVSADLAAELLARLAMTPDAGWDGDAVVELLDGIVAEAHARWPELRWHEPATAAALARALDASLPPARAFAGVHALDVLLADRCAQGDAVALAIFERELMPVVDRVLGRTRSDSSTQAELRQRVRATILVPRADAPPAIASYGGRAPLAAWLRVVATREAAALARADHHVPADEEEIDGMVAEALDPDLQLDQAAYQDELRDAFTEAFARLDSSERTLLRMHLLDKVGIDQLAAMHTVHRATAARWLQRLRQQLFDDTRRGLMKRLRLTPREFESAMRLVRSQLEVSILATSAVGDHGMDEPEVTRAICEALPEIHVDATTPDRFFFCDPERKFPFATIVTRDTEYDGASQLDRPGCFRLNLGIAKQTFTSLFAADTTHDFTALDRLMPHPVYGRMHWVCIVNPSAATFAGLRPLLVEAHEISRARHSPG